jgi:hypothetical protein
VQRAFCAVTHLFVFLANCSCRLSFEWTTDAVVRPPFLCRRTHYALNADLEPAAFWITNPGNTLTDNSAAGAQGAAVQV